MIYVQDRSDILSSDGGLTGTSEVAGVTDTCLKGLPLQILNYQPVLSKYIIQKL